MIRSDLVWRIAPNDRLFWIASQLAKTIAPVETIDFALMTPALH
jgi:hypothetical protein